MKRLLQILIFGLLVHKTSFSQAPAIQWQKSYGGSGLDNASSMQITADGGYIVAGYSSSSNGDITGNHGGNDFWVIKINKSGKIQWQKSYGGSNDDAANSIAITPDGGYIVAGWSASNDGDVTGNHGGADYWIIKLSSSGNIQWQKSLGGSLNDLATSIISTSDGGFIVNGYSLSNNGDVNGNHGGSQYGDVWIVKLTSTGSIQWQKTMGGTANDYGSSIQATVDGGYITFGFSNSTDGDVSGNHGSMDYWIVKLNSTGGIQWQKSLGGSNNDFGQYVQQTSDGGYIACGYSNSNDGDASGNHGDYDYWVLKLDAIGSLQWQKSYGGGGGDYATQIKPTADGGYVVAGHSTSGDGDISGHHAGSDQWILKINSTGTKMWQQSYGGSNDDICFALLPTSDNGYITAGASYSNDGEVTGNHGADDYWVLKLKPDPQIIAKVTIASQPGTHICFGTPVTFTANVTNGDAAPFYQWQKNNVSVGSNSSTYLDSSLNNSDSVICTVTTTGKTINSNKLKFTVNPNLTPSVSISASPSIAVCINTKIQFTATAANGGTTPVYQWQKNGVNAGSNSINYTDSVPVTGDSVTVMLTSNAICLVTNTATSNALIVRVDVPTPVIHITANKDTVICNKTAVIFNAAVTPSFLWKKNGISVGNNADTYQDSTLKTNDNIQCFLVSSAAACNNVAANIINSNKLKFKINPVPAIPSVITGPAKVTAGQSGYTFSVTGVDNVMNIWTLPTGAAITSGQGTNTIVVTWGSVAGTVSVIATNSCGASVQRNKNVTLNPSLIAPVAESRAVKSPFVTDNNIHLSPNPAGAWTNISFTTSVQDKYVITIADAQNKVLEIKNGVSVTGINTVKINTGRYAKGFYFVTIANKESGKKSKELVVGQ